MASAYLHRIPLLALILILAGFAFLLVRPLNGQASAGCDLYASPTGSDSASGTSSEPLRTPQQLVASLSSGQVGCFMAGTYDSFDEQIKVTQPGVTLTSEPGTRATIVGRLWIAEGADSVTVSHLDLDGRNAAGQPGPTVNAAHTTFDDVDVTNQHTNICFVLGSPEWGVAVETVIENSRVHDCGELPATNQDHGIYVEDSRNAVIRDSWIFNNADRGIQLYPHAIGSHIYGNVIDGNGQGVIFSGTGDESSSDNIVEHNVIADSRVRWNAESFWSGSVGSGNVLRENCVWSSTQDSYYAQDGGIMPTSEGASGFSAQGNVVADPQFGDRAAGNFNLAANSPCAFTQGSEAGGSVTLEKHQQIISANSPILLTGHASLASGRAVTILRWKEGSWQRFARRRLRADGSFVVRKKLGRVHASTTLRAMVPGAGLSPAVQITSVPDPAASGSHRVQLRVAPAQQVS